jgi:hypothetical protein
MGMKSSVQEVQLNAFTHSLVLYKVVLLLNLSVTPSCNITDSTISVLSAATAESSKKGGHSFSLLLSSV